MRVCLDAFLVVPIIVDSFQVLRRQSPQPRNTVLGGARQGARRGSKASSSLFATGSATYLDGLTRQSQAEKSQSSSPSPAIQERTCTTPPQSLTNPRYPSYSFKNYLENPFFPQINTSYPGLQLIHQEPYIFVINNFYNLCACPFASCVIASIRVIITPIYNCKFS